MCDHQIDTLLLSRYSKTEFEKKLEFFCDLNMHDSHQKSKYKIFWDITCRVLKKTNAKPPHIFQITCRPS